MTKAKSSTNTKTKTKPKTKKHELTTIDGKTITAKTTPWELFASTGEPWVEAAWDFVRALQSEEVGLYRILNHQPEEMIAAIQDASNMLAECADAFEKSPPGAPFGAHLTKAALSAQDRLREAVFLARILNRTVVQDGKVHDSINDDGYEHYHLKPECVKEDEIMNGHADGDMLTTDANTSEAKTNNVDWGAVALRAAHEAQMSDLPPDVWNMIEAPEVVAFVTCHPMTGPLKTMEEQLMAWVRKAKLPELAFAIYPPQFKPGQSGRCWTATIINASGQWAALRRAWGEIEHKAVWGTPPPVAATVKLVPNVKQ